MPQHTQLAKLEVKDFIAKWAEYFPAEPKSTEPALPDATKIILLLRFIRAARIKKMLEFGNLIISFKHTIDCKDLPKCQVLSLAYSDLDKLIMSQDVKVAVEAISIIETSAPSEKVLPFEFALAAKFIKNACQTPFPDYRQKMMKPINFFLVRLRTIHGKDIKKFDPSASADLVAKTRKPLEPLIEFLQDIVDYASKNLYMEKAIEGSYPLFEVLKSMQDCFGGHDFKMNKSKTFEPVNLLEKAGIMQDRALFYFLVNSLKSSWANVRHTSFGLLSRYADTYPEFHNSDFVNGQLIPTALEFCNDPRSMMAEATGLMLKLAFSKCIRVLDVSKISFEPSSSTSIEPIEETKSEPSPMQKRSAMLL